MMMWKTKVWKFRTIEGANEARVKMAAWLERRAGRIQYEEIFVDNAYAVQYRELMRVY
jgi:hypothetical protein